MHVCQDQVLTQQVLGPKDSERREIGLLRTNFDEPLDFNKGTEATESRTQVWKQRRSSDDLEHRDRRDRRQNLTGRSLESTGRRPAEVMQS